MPLQFLILAPRRRKDPQPENLLLEHLATYGKITRTSDWVSLFNYASITQFSAIFISCAAYADEHRQWIKDIRYLHPHQPIILFSAYDSFDVRVIHETTRIFGLLKLGDIKTSLKLMIEQLELYLKFRSDLKGKVSKELLRPGGFGAFVGNSVEMLGVYRQLTRVAVSEYTVLIQGESGSGKELVARTIHKLSDRRDKPFISINCAAIPENLLESELFGYEKGAFTGAVRAKVGKFELADKGTLFLDEIGDMPVELQVKLLRVLEDGMVQALGSVQDKKVDIRLVTATHRDLPTQIAKGVFREDLHYRLNVIPISLPALRHRQTDISLLVLHFLEKLLRGDDQTIKRVAWKLISDVSNLELHGNVRELENLLTRGVFQTDGQLMSSEAFQIPNRTPKLDSNPLSDSSATDSVLKPLWEIEKDALEHALSKLDGNISQVASQLEISRTAIYRKIKKYNIDFSDGGTDMGEDHA